MTAEVVLINCCQRKQEANNNRSEQESVDSKAKMESLDEPKKAFDRQAHLRPSQVDDRADKLHTQDSELSKERKISSFRVARPKASRKELQVTSLGQSELPCGVDHETRLRRNLGSKGNMSQLVDMQSLVQ